jgi:hypothetical protein
MKFRLLLSLITVMLFGCKKDGDDSTDKLNSDLHNVKTMIVASDVGYGVQTDTFNITYDNQNRLLSRISIGARAQTYLFTYEKDRYYQDMTTGASTVRATYILNSRKLVDSSINPYTSNYTLYTKYIYNSKDQLIERREHQSVNNNPQVLTDHLYFTYDADGVLLKREGLYDINEYKYDQVIKNTVNLGIPYMQVTKQLPTEVLVYTKGNLSDRYTYSYTFDAQGRIASQQYVKGNFMFRQTYIY